MENNKNELMEMQAGEIGSLEAEFVATGKAYCSFVAETAEEKDALFTAMNNPTFRLEEKLNTTIYLKDIYAEQVTLLGETTGELIETIRMVLIDVDGQSYGCCSVGIFSAIKKLMQVYGPPSWEDPIAVQPYQQPTRNGRNKVFTLRIAKG